MRPTERRATATPPDGAHTPPSDLIVVSNRQPYRHTRTDGELTIDEPTGGLTAGLDPVLQETGGTWIAWGDGDGDWDVTDEQDCIRVPPHESDQYTLRRLKLEQAAIDGYYTGYSNRVLWPLCHEMGSLLDVREGDLEWYRSVNRSFAEAVIDHATAESVIWLQDYHLALAPQIIRESVSATGGATIGQFWHIPWPTPEVFGACPNARELLEGLLGNDVLGFHVPSYGANFLSCVETFLSGATVEYQSKTVEYDGNRTRVVSTPMGVNADRYHTQALEAPDTQWEDFCAAYGIPPNSSLGLGVDRLDYAKGIPERLTALEHLFETAPSWRESFTFIQKATPSRTDIPAYEHLGEHVRERVSEINDRFGTENWQPIVYTEDILEQSTLAAMYREADMLVVSSIKDGMNLVAQEYVASSLGNEGALVLSDRTGAADVLGYPAYTIDPTDTERFAQTLETALTAPQSERRSRMAALRDHAFDHDLEWWMHQQFGHLNAAHNSTPPQTTSNPFQSE